MDFISLAGIAVGLSMDAFAVSVAEGTTLRIKCPQHPAVQTLRLSVCFGFFQALMPCIGWVIGKAGESLIGKLDHWIAFVLLCWIGIQMILEAGSDECPRGAAADIKRLLAMGIATSIDALAAGIILPSAVGASSAPLLLLSVGIIGVVTLCLCFAGVAIGRKFGELFAGKAQILGGVMLLIIGARILAEHLFFE